MKRWGVSSCFTVWVVKFSDLWVGDAISCGSGVHSVSFERCPVGVSQLVGPAPIGIASVDLLPVVASVVVNFVV